eukprot:1989456-Rhodomonas_salina.3
MDESLGQAVRTERGRQWRMGEREEERDVNSVDFLRCDLDPDPMQPLEHFIACDAPVAICVEQLGLQMRVPVSLVFEGCGECGQLSACRCNAGRRTYDPIVGDFALVDCLPAPPQRCPAPVGPAHHPHINTA